VQFVQNARGYKRGERIQVKSAGPSGVTIEREDGRIEPLALQRAKHFQVYEGREIALAKGDRVRITQNGFTAETRRGLLSQKSRLNNGDIYEAYVSISRGRESVAIYTDDKEAMMQAAQEDSTRLSATELMDGQRPVVRSSKIARLIHTQKIKRAYQEVRERMDWYVPPKEREVRLGL
jgi:hypothetical protein